MLSPFVVATCLILATGHQPVFASSYVDPFIGCSENGHTFPGACRPFGLVQASPDTGNFDWVHCAGYLWTDQTTSGFSQTHLNGTGNGDLGDLLVVPDPCQDGAASGRPLKIVKATETASPGSYAVTLGNGVRTEITATAHAAFYRFTFPDDGTNHLVAVNLDWGLVSESPNLEGHLLAEEHATGDRTVEGHIRTKGWATRDVFFALEAGAGARTAPAGRPHGVLFNFGAARTGELKIGLSTTGTAAARTNRTAELPPGKDFDAVRAEARAEWDALLGRVEIDGTPDEKKSFYTALYHLFIQPNNLADAGAAPYYSTFSLWDTYRAAHPLYTILAPERVPGFVDTMLRHQQKNGVLPMWALWGQETWAMTGHHAVPVIVDAYLKGFPMDAEATYAAVKATLTTRDPAVRRADFACYDKYGYLPFDIVRGEGVARQMEDSFDAHCAAVMAEKLGKKDDAAYFRARAEMWTNIFDRTTGFVRGRDSKGAWRTPFDPFEIGHNSYDTKDNDYTEGNAWQWTWHVLHEPAALVAALGGPAAFRKKLDTFFTLPPKKSGKTTMVDVTGLIGQYAHGNEPSHHVAYLYALAGAPHRTQELVRQICRTMYRPKFDGLCGNDDCGQMSAWYIFSCLGFYPVNPCGGEYVLGAPQVPRARIHLPGGKTFTMTANNLSDENLYVKSATLNGKPITNGKIRQADIMAGGELVFEMMPAAAAKAFHPGAPWPDDRGVHINAHGGGVLFHDGVYYWFGEHKTAGTAGNVAQVGVHVYSSTNLYDWTDRGIALAVSNDPKSELAKGCVLERPKVVFCPKTGKFSMFFHLEPKDQGYAGARVGLAVADRPCGPYRFLRSLRPNAGKWPLNIAEKDRTEATRTDAEWTTRWDGQKSPLFAHDLAGGQMTRDMTLFVDDDGQAYQIYAAEDNATLQIAELTDDFLDYTGRYARIAEEQWTEAPAICKKDGRYYLIGSGCTGWAPNAARYFTATNIFGPWERMGNPCDGVNPQNGFGPEKTWGGQSTFILPVAGRPGLFIALFDIWRPANAIDGRYVWLPVVFLPGNRIRIRWQDAWSLPRGR